MFNDLGRIVVVAGREYLLVSRVNHEVDSYLYLMSVSSPLDILIAKEKNSSASVVELVMVDDDDEKRKIYDLFIKGARLGLL